MTAINTPDDDRMYASGGRLAYSVPEAAEMIGVSRSRMYQLMAEGVIAARRLGGRTLVLHDDLVRYLGSLPVYEPEAG